MIFLSCESSTIPAKFHGYSVTKNSVVDDDPRTNWVAGRADEVAFIDFAALKAEERYRVHRARSVPRPWALKGR